MILLSHDKTNETLAMRHLFDISRLFQRLTTRQRTAQLSERRRAWKKSRSSISKDLLTSPAKDDEVFEEEEAESKNGRGTEETYSESGSNESSIDDLEDITELGQLRFYTMSSGDVAESSFAFSRYRSTTCLICK